MRRNQPRARFERADPTWLAALKGNAGEGALVGVRRATGTVAPSRGTGRIHTQCRPATDRRRASDIRVIFGDWCGPPVYWRPSRNATVGVVLTVLSEALGATFVRRMASPTNP